jgi:plastocyanin
MSKTSRRNLLKATAAAGVFAAFGFPIKAETRDAEKKSHQHQPIAGPLANATVSFGAWPTDPALDRFPNLGAPVKPNQHQLIPHEATIKAGGSVNFIIAGFHHVLVYDDGTQPTDINAALANPAFPALIDDPNNRIYRGLDPRLFPQDRVEVVHFSKPGTYLVICGFRLHFVNDQMFGFVKVIA